MQLRLTLALLLCLAPAALAQTVQITASNISNLFGTKLASGRVCLQATDSKGIPIAFKSGGSAQITYQPGQAACAAVVSGAFAVTVPDTALTVPVNVCYALTVKDLSNGQTVLGQKAAGQPSGYDCLQPTVSNSWCSGGICNFDNYQPNLAALVTVQQGPPGPSLKPRGAWNNSTAYAVGDLVSYTDGNNYAALVANTNQVPTNTAYWQLDNAAQPSIFVINHSAPSAYQQARLQIQATGEVDPLDVLTSSGSLFQRTQYYLPWFTADVHFQQGILYFPTPVYNFLNVGGLTVKGRYNSYRLYDPGAGSCTVSHSGAGGGVTVYYSVRFVDANSGYSLPSPLCSDANGYATGSLDVAHYNIITYHQPTGGYANMILSRGTDPQVVVSSPNHIADGVLSEWTACGFPSCTLNDQGTSITGPDVSLQSLAVAFWANPDANTTASMLLNGKLYTFNGSNMTGGTYHYGAIKMLTSGNPSAPTVTPNTTGSTTYSYYFACRDYVGGYSLVSPVATITNGNATPNNTVSYSCPLGYDSADVLKTDTVHYLSMGLPPSGSITDTGQALTTYSPPTRNSTADLFTNQLLAGMDGSPSYFNGDVYFGGIINVFSNAYGNGVHASDRISGHGEVYMGSGDAAHSGFIKWLDPTGTQLGYMGYDNTARITLWLQSVPFDVEGGDIQSRGNPVTSVGTMPVVNTAVCWKDVTNKILGYCSTALSGSPPTCTCN